MTGPHDWLDKHIVEQAAHYGLTPNAKAALFKGAAEFDEMLTAGVVDEPTKETEMKKYTVLLLRPDYIASEFGKDTYLSHVEAASAGAAQVQAQVEARDSDQEPDDDDWNDPTDYHVQCVFEGHLNDLTTGETSENEGSVCPTCGADGGTTCGAIKCGLLT